MLVGGVEGGSVAVERAEDGWVVKWMLDEAAAGVNVNGELSSHGDKEVRVATIDGCVVLKRKLTLRPPRIAE